MTKTMPSAKWRKRSAAGATLLAIIGGALAVPSAAQAAPEVPTEPVISSAATTWQYLDDGSDPSPAGAALREWTTPAFDDSSWKSAQGSFGAKRGKLAPVGPHTPNTLLNQYIDGASAPNVPTFFFRSSFTLDAGVASEVGSVIGDVVYDDGLVVWLNGTRVAGFAADRVNETTNQVYAGSGASDPAAETFYADPALLVDGENTIAMALYQDRDTSSDIFLDVPSIRLTQAGTVIEAAPSRVILTPTTTPDSSQSFSWLAGDMSHTSGQVELRPAAGGDVRTVDGYLAGAVNGNPKSHYSATVTGLTPATAYSYRVGVEGGWSPWHEFTTADPNATDFQFVYYGDAQIGLDSTWPEVVRQAEATATRSIGSVHAGDLIDTGSNETQWNNWFTGMENSAATSNVMAAPGNHEYSGDKKLAAWKANFEYPSNNPTTETIGALADLAVGDSEVARQYAAYFEHWSEFAAETVYYTDYQGVRFITINATRDSAFLTPDNLPACTVAGCPSTQVSRLWTEFQAAWLDFVLTESPSKWNVVTFHQPVFSTSAGRDEPVLRKLWVPVFQAHNIDLVLMGHDHTYARGFLNTDMTDTPGITTGPVYAVSNSGAKHYSLETPEKNVWTNNGATQVLRGQGVTTYQVIDVTSGSLVYRSYLAEKTAGASTDLPVGAVYDEFTITKSDAGEKWVTETGLTPPVTVDPDVAPAPIDTTLLTAENRGGVSGPADAEQGGTVELSIGAAQADTQVWVSLHSDPVSLGRLTADAQGALVATLPADAAVGDHQLVVQAADGTLIGWAPLNITAADAGGAAEGTGSAGGAAGGAADGSGATGTASGSTAGVAAGSGLASTGAENAVAIWAALAILMVGGGVLLAARQRRSVRTAAPTDARDLAASNEPLS